MENVLFQTSAASVPNSGIVKLDPEDLKACQSWMESVSSGDFFASPTVKPEYENNDPLGPVVNDERMPILRDSTNPAQASQNNNTLHTPASPGGLSYASSRSNSLIGEENEESSFPLTRSNSNTSSLLDPFESATSWLDADMFSSAPFLKPSYELDQQQTKLLTAVNGLNQRFQLNPPASYPSTYTTNSPSDDIASSSVSTPGTNNYDSYNTNSQDISAYSSIATSPVISMTCDRQNESSNSPNMSYDSLPIKQEDDIYTLVQETPKVAPRNIQLVSQPSTISSSSTPASSTPSTPSITPSNSTAPPKKKRGPRKKLTNTQKIAHNKIEKRYRNNINDRILGLKEIIPWLSGDANDADKTDLVTPSNNDAGCAETSNQRLNKSKILEKAVAYILHIQEVNKKLESTNQQLSQQLLALNK
ncbi:HLH-domain-containing protein [Nadsonia fulvescens var. elongata DSM 6958]|uniref:HLH-domain-containing protein n=1 Tax=Nadsonia fulvescens var. elongata DSM 6958 TaxID=857566 RepID=A0A1E3PJR2_9ASCO|nr:HLH-domain-containing protein [Nadsonia fulvescens var. elongata DSM 6958]